MRHGMPARDFYHDVVKAALIADGWTITDDPYLLEAGEKDLYVDLGAERLIAADKLGQKIAVEVKSFLGPSEVRDLELALGQFVLYHDLLEESEPDRRLFLAMPEEAYDHLFTVPIGLVLLKRNRLRLIVFEPDLGVILRWIPSWT
jgi:hypothetical protein